MEDTNGGTFDIELEVRQRFMYDYSCGQEVVFTMENIKSKRLRVPSI